MKKTNYWKWGIIIAAALLIFYSGCEYGVHGFIKKHSGIDTTLHDTKVEIQYQPVPYKVDSIVYKDRWHKSPDMWFVDVPESSKVQLVRDYSYALPVDTAAIIRRFFQTAYYDTLIKLSRGTARLKDTVAFNRIQGRSIQLSNTDTTITKEVILTQPKRAIVYLNTSVMGNNKNWFSGVGWGLSLKTRTDVIYGTEVKFTKFGTMYEAKYYYPIKSKRNR